MFNYCHMGCTLKHFDGENVIGHVNGLTKKLRGCNILVNHIMYADDGVVSSSSFTCMFYLCVA